MCVRRPGKVGCFHVLGSFIFGLATDDPSTFDATVALAKQADVTFAQFVMMTPFPGTVDFDHWEKSLGEGAERIQDVPVTRYWLLPGHARPKLYMPHPKMTAEEIRMRTQAVWDEFYSFPEIWHRSRCVKALKSRLVFMLISKLYRQMYANTGIATDSARRQTVQSMGAVAGETMPSLLPSETDAGLGRSRHHPARVRHRAEQPMRGVET